MDVGARADEEEEDGEERLEVEQGGLWRIKGDTQRERNRGRAVQEEDDSGAE